MIQEESIVDSGLARYYAKHGTHEGKNTPIFLESQVNYFQKLARASEACVG